MLKRSIAAICLLCAPVAVNIPTASAATSAVDGVTVAWADVNHTAVKITWNSPLADTVTLKSTDAIDFPLGKTAAGAPNYLVVPVVNFGVSLDAAAKSHVVVTDSTGAEARSVDFDRFARTGMVPTVSIGAGNVVRGTTVVTKFTDSTPGDPLDVTAPQRYAPHIITSDVYTNCHYQPFAASNSPSFAVPVQVKPGVLQVKLSNEWPLDPVQEDAHHVSLETAALKTTAPTSTGYAQPFTLAGQVFQNHMAYTPWNSTCFPEYTATRARTVVVQARKDARYAWVAVGSTRTDAGDKFSYRVTNPGTRQYRVVVPNRVTPASGTQGPRAELGTATLPRTVTATTRVLSAKFLTPTVTYGHASAAYLAVSPAGSQRALLQSRSATGTWSGVAYKTLAAGKGSVAVTWKKRGVTAFRWYVPASTTSTGLTVGATISPSFNLTVR
jgi:hypothetical protein